MEQVYLMIAVSVVTLIGAIAYSFNLNKKWKNAFREFADRHNLKFETGKVSFSIRAEGSNKYVTASVFRENFKSGKNSIVTVGFQVSLKAEFVKYLRVETEGFFSRRRKKKGETDIEMNSPEFDNLALLGGTATHHTRAMLHPNARRIIVSLIRDSYAKKFSIINGMLETYQVMRSTTDSAFISNKYDI